MTWCEIVVSVFEIMFGSEGDVGTRLRAKILMNE
jgi:hypothetical protein